VEFDTITPASDEDRRLAEAKKLILQPLHGDISPEPTSGAEIARHLAGPAIANSGSDIEQDVAHIEPSKGLLEKDMSDAMKKRLPSPGFIVIAVLSVSIAATAGFLIFIR
jgi:hypothetical protein